MPLSSEAPCSSKLQAEHQALRSLVRQLTTAPETLLQSVVAIALDLTQAGTAGISVLETTADGTEIFRDCAVAGTLAEFVDRTTPRHFSLSGICLERVQSDDKSAPQLFSYPERYFTDIQATHTPIPEALVLPIMAESHALGTLWILSHSGQRQFDLEDVRIMTGLADLATAHLWNQRQIQQTKLRDSEAQLAADLVGMRRLCDLHAKLLSETDLHRALEEITATAIEFTGTDRGCVQLVSEDGERLEMFAYRGYTSDSRFIQHFLHEGSKPACDAARRTQQRLIIEDVTTFPGLLGTPDREVALSEDIRATQSTPMISRKGELIGVLSTQFRQPHRSSDHELRLIDLLAWTAADFVERHQAEAAQQIFFSNISHEFRTPLTLLLSGIEAVLGNLTDAPAQRAQLELAHRSSLRLLKLVNTLLDVSRIEAGRLQATYEPTDLASLTAELASVFRSAIERAKLRLVVDCPPQQQPIYIDREIWEKIVLNLISNAFKFTLKGVITVRLHLVGDQIELAVQDTGIGIPAAEIPHLFERFYRVKGSQGRTFEGSGIGLSLVQELVKLHKGTVQVSSVEGSGSCFSVFIPTGCAPEPAERIGATHTLASTAMGASPYVEEALRWLTEENESVEAVKNRKERIAFTPTYPHVPSSASSRILLVDDNADMRDYVKRLLSERWQVETAANGAIALNMIQQQLPDLVLTDVMMPEVDGFQLLNTLRADPITKSIPIILLSARAGEEATVEGLEAGADDYLIKPFSARELMARVETQLQMSQLRQQQSANRFKNEFLMTVTHELQSPLAKILGWARLLKSQPFDSVKAAQALDMIERNATIEAKLVKDLLDVSSILSGKLRLKPQVVDLASLVRNVTTTFREVAETKHIQLIETISDNLPSNVFADGDRLKQVIANLLENAIKFTPLGGQVNIRLERLDSNIEITISDTGSGIPPDFLPYVFDRFTQAEVPSRHSPGGVGIGLAIARHIVELHHGAITATSEGEGRGATFTVKLPLGDSTQPNLNAQVRQ